MKRAMEKIYNKIRRSNINDSEIIQDVKSAKEISGSDINLGDNAGWSSLMLAVGMNRKELVEYLLSVPDINHKDSGGNTALHFCEQRVSILKLLLSRRDLDVNIQNNQGETGLHRVCIWGRKTCVKEYLLDARSDTLICDVDGETVRDKALKWGYSDIVKIIGNSRHAILLRIPNYLLLYDIVRMIIEEYA